MAGKTQLTIRLPDKVVVEIDRAIFGRRVAKAPGRAASRSSIVAELVEAAILFPVSKGGQS
jgi:hypothetical protein